MIYDQRSFLLHARSMDSEWSVREQHTLKEQIRGSLQEYTNLHFGSCILRWHLLAANFLILPSSDRSQFRAVYGVTPPHVQSAN